MPKEPSELAKQFIDRSLEKASRKGEPKKPPSKAAYARGVRLARLALEELAHVAHRAQTGRA